MNVQTWLAIVVVASGCSNENAGGGASASAQAASAKAKSAAPAASSVPAKTAPAAAPAEVKAAAVPANSLGVTMTLKPGAMEGDSYKTNAEVENKSAKEISGVAWKVCAYDASGKLQDGDTANIGDAAAKPNGKADVEVWVKPAPLVGFRITQVKFADGSTQDADFADKSCPDTIKP